MNKKTSLSLILIAALGVGIYFLMPKSQGININEYLKEAIEESNAYEFDKALDKLDTIINHEKASEEQKNLAYLLKKIVLALKKDPLNVKLLDNLNDLALKKGALDSKTLQEIKEKTLKSPLKDLAKEKALLMKELDSLNKIDTSKMSAKEKRALEEKKIDLLDRLRQILDQEKLGNKALSSGDYCKKILKAKNNEIDLLKKKIADLEKNQKETPKPATKKVSKKSLALDKATLEKIKRLKKLGLKALADEKYKDALKYYDEAYKLNPHDADIEALRAILQSRLKQSAKAGKSVKDAKKDDKGEYSVPLAEAENNYAKGKMKEAEKGYLKSIKRKNNALALYRLGTIELKKGNSVKATDFYKRAYNAPDKEVLEKTFHVKLTYNIAKSYEKQKLYSQAIKMYKESLSLDSSYLYAGVALGQIYYSQKNYQQAISTVSKSLEKNPGNPYLLNVLGKSYHQLGDNKKAEDAFKEAVAKNPKNSVAFYNLALQQIIVKNYTEATNNLQKSLQLKNDSKTKIQLGIVYTYSKNYPLAKKVLSEVLTTHPKDIDTLKALVTVYLAEKNLPIAVNYINKALAIDPKNTSLLTKLGIAYFKQNQLNEALATFKKIDDLQPTGKSASQVAIVYSKLNDNNNALAYYQKAYDRGKDAQYLEKKANTYLKMKNYTEAEKTLNTILTNQPNYKNASKVRTKLAGIKKIVSLQTNSI